MKRLIAINSRTRETREVSENEAYNLDVRLWDIQEIGEKTPIGNLEMLCLHTENIDIFPIMSLSQLQNTRISNTGNLIYL